MKQETKFKDSEIGLIPEDWEVKAIDDFVKIKHGFAFKGGSFTKQKNNQIVLTPGNVHIGGGFKPNKFKFTTQECPEDYILKEGEIIVSMTDLSKKGDTLGYAAKIPKSNKKKYLHNQRLGLLQFRNNEIQKDFLYWALRTKKYNHFVVGSATGSTVKHTSPTRIGNYKFAFPPILEQKAIAKSLSDLDSKLELLQKNNETLEKIGLNLFKEYVSNIVTLGTGWEELSLDRIAHYLNGLALQKYPPKGENDLSVIKIRELKQGITDKTDLANSSIPTEYIVKDGDILFSWSGSLEVVIWCGGEGALNQHLFKVTSETYPKWFYYYWTLHHLMKFKGIAADKATTMGHIKRTHLSEAKVLVPPKQEMEELSQIFIPIVNKIININLEIRSLRKTRDLLLPKLMSGKIRVPIEVKI